MKVRFDYGRDGREVDVPAHNLIGILHSHPAPGIPAPSDAIALALRQPIGAQPLLELALGHKNACLVICDITRPVPNPVLLPPVIETLNRAGIPTDQITILIATGTHRPNIGAELDDLVGAEVARTVRIVNHRSRDIHSHTYVGRSPSGLSVWLDSLYCNADFKLTIGLIEPHFMAGYSGGRKLIMPGIAATETIQRWHCPQFLESPYATNGVLEHNPVHAESLAIARMARPDFILDVSLNDSNEITGIFAGDMEDAWNQGVNFVAQHVKASIPHHADIAVTTCAGFPLDATFYQAVKGMVGAMSAVKPGGTIVIAAECAEGIGSPEFTNALLEAEDLEQFVAHISQPDVFIPEEWQIEELARAKRHADVVFVTDGIEPNLLQRCFVTPAQSLEEGIAIALDKQGPNATLVAIPRGPYVIPTLNATDEL